MTNNQKLKKKGQNDAWIKSTLGDISKEYRVSNKTIHHQNLLSLSYGKIVQKDINSKKGLLPASFDTYQIIKEGIIVFRVTDLQNDKKSLRVGLSTQEGIISPAYVCVECDKEKITPSFLFILLHYYDAITKVMYKMGDGLRQTLSFSDLKNLIVYIPSIIEQHFVVDVFQNIDKFIDEQTAHLTSLKQVKAASLQGMFPQDGESVPRVRFKGFDGEWRKVKLEECLEISSERNLNNEYGVNEVLSVSDEVGVVNQIKLLGRSYAGKSVSNYKVLRTNQIVYTKSPLKAKPYGIVKVNRGEIGIVSVLYAVYNTKEEVSPDFIHYYFDPCFRINNYLLPLISKGAKNTMNISDEMALQGNIMIPETLKEQQKIADYFTTLDRQIDLETQRIEKLRQIKSACLDKMFV